MNIHTHTQPLNILENSHAYTIFFCRSLIENPHFTTHHIYSRPPKQQDETINL